MSYVAWQFRKMHAKLIIELDDHLKILLTNTEEQIDSTLLLGSTYLNNNEHSKNKNITILKKP